MKDLFFRYAEGDFALEIPHLTLRAREPVAIIGPSGSGKTTFLHLVAGICRPERGVVTTCGRDLQSMREDERRAVRIDQIGLVFQEFELLEYLTVLDNILLPRRLEPAGRSISEWVPRARELAGRLGMERHLGRHPAQLSQGERQRVAICRALLAGPELLLADEPTGNLDPGNKGKVLDILLACAQESGATLVTVTHDRDLLDRFERVIDFKSFYASGASEGGSP